MPSSDSRVEKPETSNGEPMNEPLSEALFSELKRQIEALLPSLSERLLPAGKNLFLRNAKQLETWASQLAAGELTPDDVEWLVRSSMDLTRLTALESAGLAQVDLDHFRQVVIQTTLGMLVGRITMKSS